MHPKVARDITERRVAEDILKEGVQVRETLSRIGASLAAELDPDKLVQAVTDAATTFTSAEFGAFIYNAVDDSGAPSALHAVRRDERSFRGFPELWSDGAVRLAVSR